jgi:nitrogen fixation/metabolism regulation signal transduction histidine kinase
MISLIAATGLFSLMTTTKISENLAEIMMEERPNLEKADFVSRDFLMARDTFITFVRREETDVYPVLRLADKVIKESEDLNKTAKERDKDKVSTFIKSAKLFKLTINTYVEESAIDPTGASTIEMEDVALAAVKDATDAMYKMMDGIRADIRAADINAFIVAKESQKSVLIIVGLGVFAGLFIALFMGRAMSRPIRRLVSGTENIAKGNLDYKIELGYRGELGKLADSFNNMAEDLKLYMEKEKKKSAELEKAYKDLKDAQDIIL